MYIVSVHAWVCGLKNCVWVLPLYTFVLFSCVFLCSESLADIRRADKESSVKAVDTLIEALREKDDPGWFQRFKEALIECGKL